MTERSRKAARAAEERKKRKERAFRDDAGRVHLALHRDPASGQELVRLKAPLFKEQWQNEVVAGAANTALGVLGHEPTLEGVVRLAQSVMASTSQLAEGFLAHAPEGSVACKAGCDHCCYQIVGATAPEALTILDHVQRTRTPAELERLKAHVAERREKSRGLTSSERFSPEQPCVFLEAGRCTIYEVRPLACRGMNSLDAKECETRLRDPAVRAEFVVHGGGHLFVAPIQAFRAVSAGLQVSLAELYRLDARPLDLTVVMDMLLQGSPSLAAEWIEGRRPFEAALRAPE